MEIIYECADCGHLWKDSFEPDTNADGEFICDRCEGE